MTYIKRVKLVFLLITWRLERRHHENKFKKYIRDGRDFQLELTGRRFGYLLKQMQCFEVIMSSGRNERVLKVVVKALLDILTMQKASIYQHGEGWPQLSCYFILLQLSSPWVTIKYLLIILIFNFSSFLLRNYCYTG